MALKTDFFPVIERKNLCPNQGKSFTPLLLSRDMNQCHFIGSDIRANLVGHGNTAGQPRARAASGRAGGTQKTTQAKHETEIARLAEVIAQRDTANTRWVVGSVAVAAIFIVAVLGLLLRLPAPTP